MKKSFIISILLLPLLVFAQQTFKGISFYVQGGYRSAPYVSESKHKEIVSATETNHHRCIILNAGLQKEISEKWRVGFSFTYDHFGTKRRSVEFSNISYMIRLDRTWKQKGGFSLYSGLATGIRKMRKFENETEIKRNTEFSYQIYVAGLNYKLFNRFYLDVNTGWGVAGIASFGAKYNF